MYPALAVVPHLASPAPAPAADAATPAAASNGERDANLLWIGSREGMERAIVEEAGIAYQSIDTGQVRGINPLKAGASLWRMQRGLRQSLQAIKRFQPQVCLVTGGYVCGPVVLACRLRRVPVLIYLPDMSPGWAIQGLSKVAQRVAVTFEDAASYFGGPMPQGKAVVSGYPVRQELIAAAANRAATRRELANKIDRPPLNGEDGLPLVLIFGGSQGARSINRAVWADLGDLLPHTHVLHVVGHRDWPLAKEAMQELRQSGVLSGGSTRRYHPVDYLHDAMPLALAAADLAVSRAGASVLGEFTVAGLPSILVPLPYAGVNQARNAEQLTRHGAAVTVEDSALSTELARTVVELLTQQERLGNMAAAAAALARPDAARRIAKELCTLAGATPRT